MATAEESYANYGAILFINRAMEFLWLSVAILVPLIVAPTDSMILYVQLPKVALLRTLAGLLVILWVMEWAISARSESKLPNFAGIKALKSWVMEQPPRLVLVTSSMFMFVYFLSTILSTSPRTSMWGGSANVDNYSLYNMIVYFALFLVVAVHLRTRAQLWRLLSAIVIVGAISSLLGILEYLRLIPLGDVRPANPRISSTFGNPIFFASVLLLTIPLSIAAFLTRWGRLDFKGRCALWVGLLSAQFLAFLLTLSRGPWVGLAAGLIGFLVLAPVLLRSNIVLKAAFLIIVGLALAIGAAWILPTPAERNPFDTSLVGNDTSLVGDDLSPDERLFSIYGQVASGGLNNRITIWKASGRLIVNRPWFPSEELPLSFLRPIIGYGPDLFWYVFPLEADDTVGLHFHAHNQILNTAVELGYLGVIAYLIFVGSVFLSGAMLLLELRREDSSAYKIIVLMILVVLSARFIERLVGVPQVGDFTLFWLLLGIFVALPRIMEGDEGVYTERRITSNIKSGSVSIIRLGFASIALVVMLWMIFSKNVNYVMADFVAARAFETESLDEATSLIDRASEFAPFTPNYYLHGYDILRGAAASADSPEARAALAEKAYVYTSLAAKIDPLSNTARVKLANASLDLGRLGYDGLKVEAVGIYKRIIDSTPRMEKLHGHLRTLMAIAYIESNQPQQGAIVLDRVISEEQDEGRRARALYLKGVAHKELGLSGDAIASLNSLLEMDFEGDAGIKSEAHLLLSQIYEESGDSARSREHARLYEEFKRQNES